MMAMLIALNIVEGRITFKQVTKRYRKAVREQLILLGFEHLAYDNPVEPKED